MQNMISREIKRAALMKDCEHSWITKPVKDPVDNRRTLKITGMVVARCSKCGAAKLSP